ncbi:relaxase domain-containing protein [Runella sp. CRIBMP]|uniref:MobF family relaxase n=1 Tax=Runella sp. CRIBMP TaxID=2683261 RepID=UPI001412EFE6|nr:MobF family relaxase [Runella sp. CRIBMP]NBB23405.1 relaxase domain-containing protein [Runella sp. CRIBMP]
MLRITANTSPEGASKYYDEGLSRSDYYTQKNDVIGKWNGKAATKLELGEDITKEQFEALCYNKNPETQEQLTARNNETRRVGYDFTFSVPKSVSIAYATTEDKELLEAFRNSVQNTMSHIEENMETRIRKNGASDNRTTGNMVWGEFIHTTARPVDGLPDCHLHAHCFAFNATYDDQEQKWKAGEFGNIKSEAPYYEAYFNSMLANNLQKAGYNLERNDINFELASVSRETIEKFSRRTTEIEKLAADKEITNAKALDQLGAKTRENKRDGLTAEQLKSEWANRLTEDEKKNFATAKGGPFTVEKKKQISPDQAIDHALEHSLERKSVVQEKQLLTEAMKRGYTSFSPDELKQAYEKRKDLIFANENGKKILTTKNALNEENKLVKTCVESKGRFKPLNDNYQFQNPDLNPEQRKAVSHALGSNDGIVIIEGGAGTGKTTLMSEVKAGIEQNGKQIFAFAPSSEASRGVLRGEGYQEADTLAALLINKKLQEQTKGHVLWVDEAGMVGNKTMNQLLDLAKTNQNRLIFTGDTKQHASVERGDALRTMQQKGGINAVRVNEVVRQKNQKDYKTAMEFMSKGNIEKGFSKLDDMGAIREIGDREQRNKEIAQEYLQGISERKGKGFKDVLVVAPTHKEGEMVTSEIRQTLRSKGKLGKDDKEFERLKNLNFTEAQKKDAVNYQAGHLVEFHQNIKGFKAGEKFAVTGRDEKGNVLVKMASEKNGKSLPLHEANNFQVFQKQKIELSEKDKIRITKNGKSEEGTKLNNGQIYSVRRFDKEGNVELSNGTTLNKNFGHFTHGYAVTSDASQGKTVDKVIVAQSSYSFGAATQQQFYVSVSRAREAVAVYTDSKADLARVVTGRSAERMAASDVAASAAANDNRLREQQAFLSRLAQLRQAYTTWKQSRASQARQRAFEMAKKVEVQIKPENTFTQTQKPDNQNVNTQRVAPRRK